MKKYFMTGLVILLPMVLTVVILIFLVDLLTGPFVGLVEQTLAASTWGRRLEEIPGAMHIIHYGTQIAILVALFFVTVLLGVIGRWFFFRYLIQLGDLILHRIPFVNKVYKTSQDIIKTIFQSKAESFKQVVMVPFPNPDIYSIGFVSSDSPPRCKTAVKRDLISVFVPTTPNPTSGYLLLFPKENCVFLEMKVEDAIKFIISCGVIHEGAPGITPSKRRVEDLVDEPPPAPESTE